MTMPKTIKDLLTSASTWFVVVLAITAFTAQFWAPYGFAEQDLTHRLKGPSADHWFGTDHLGRDIFSRALFGLGLAFRTALPAIGLAAGIGTLLGIIAGFIGGRIDQLVLIVLDTLQAFPSIIFALTVLALLGPDYLIVVLGVAFVPGYARVVRSQVISVKEREFVKAADALGAGPFRVLFQHIVPNILSPIVILAAMDIPSVITVEAGLSFLGLGVRPPAPSWGVMLSEGFRYVRNAPWQIIGAGTFLIVATLTFTMFGERLRDIFDPREGAA